MPATLTKVEIKKALEQLPDEELALEDVIEHLVVLYKVHQGLAQDGEGVPHEKVVKRFRTPGDGRP